MTQTLIDATLRYGVLMALRTNGFYSLLAASAVIAGLQGTASAASVQFLGSGTNPASGNPLMSEVTFSDTSNPGFLTVKLTNLKPASVPSDLLTGVFWDIAGNPSLNLGSATASTRIINSTVTPGFVNLLATPRREWGFSRTTNPAGLGGAVAPKVTQRYGLGTAGFGINPGFGLSGGQQLNYGIVSAINSNANSPVRTGTFVKDSAIFLFSLPNNFDVATISNIRLQYGTALNEPSLAGVKVIPQTEIPEPSMAFAILGIAGLGLLLKKSSNSDSDFYDSDQP